MVHAQVRFTLCEDLDTYEALRAVVETCRCVKTKDVAALRRAACSLCGPKYNSQTMPVQCWIKSLLVVLIKNAYMY